MGRGNYRPLADVVGRGAVDRGDRPAAWGHKECHRRESPSAGSAGPAFADPSRRKRRSATPAQAAAGSRTDAAAAFQHLICHCSGQRTNDPAADGRLGAQAGPIAAVGPRGTAATAALWPNNHLLLADRRPWHPKLQVLRRGVGARKAVLLRSCASRLCQGARPARGRGLTTYSATASRIARGVAAVSCSCVIGRSAWMNP